MGHFVIDGSVTVAWCIPEERTSRTQALLDKVIEAGAVVPIHWWIEVGNALLVATRRARISVAQRRTALTQLAALQLLTDPETLDRLWTATLDLADRSRLTLYDACYLELALRRGLPLATLDRDLRAAGQALGLTLLGV
ncbi:MAG: type II toxin-antitoxin system VapC family toxin [Rhodoplanes sp.]